MVAQALKLRSVLTPNPGSFLSHHGQKLLERVSDRPSRKIPIVLSFPAFPCIGAMAELRGQVGSFSLFTNGELKVLQE